MRHMCATITLHYNGVQQLTTRTAKLQNCHLNRSPEFFEQDVQTLASTWTESVVHCVFDDKEKNTKALAANDRRPAAPTIMQNYMRRRW